MPFATRVAAPLALLGPSISTHNSDFPSMTRRSTVHQGLPADEQRFKWSKLALAIVAVGGKCRGGGPILMVNVRKRCYHIDSLWALWPYLLCCARITKLDIRGPPPVPRYTVARGRLPRREYWSQPHRKLPSKFFSPPLQSSVFFDRPLPYQIQALSRSLRGRQQAGQPRSVLISFGQIGTLGTHMNNRLRVFHHNTLIVYISTSHLVQNRMESRSRRAVTRESHSKETARPRDKPL